MVEKINNNICIDDNFIYTYCKKQKLQKILKAKIKFVARNLNNKKYFLNSPKNCNSTNKYRTNCYVPNRHIDNMQKELSEISEGTKRYKDIRKSRGHIVRWSMGGFCALLGIVVLALSVVMLHDKMPASIIGIICGIFILAGAINIGKTVKTCCPNCGKGKNGHQLVLVETLDVDANGVRTENINETVKKVTYMLFTYRCKKCHKLWSTRGDYVEVKIDKKSKEQIIKKENKQFAKKCP